MIDNYYTYLPILFIFIYSKIGCEMCTILVEHNINKYIMIVHAICDLKNNLFNTKSNYHLSYDLNSSHNYCIMNCVNKGHSM